MLARYGRVIKDIYEHWCGTEGSEADKIKGVQSDLQLFLVQHLAGDHSSDFCADRSCGGGDRSPDYS